MQDRPDPGAWPLKVCIGNGKSAGAEHEPNNTHSTMRTQNNHVRLIGNLGHAPEVREIAPGRKVARLSMATHESYLNAEGERVTDTQWHTVVAWGRIAEQVGLFLEKGSPVMVEGRIVHRSYPGKDGIKRYITEVVLHDFKVIAYGPKEKEAARQAA